MYIVQFMVTALPLSLENQSFSYHFHCYFKANACFGQPCQNGGTCSLASNAKGYTCNCNAGYDQATDCRTREFPFPVNLFIDLCISQL